MKLIITEKPSAGQAYARVLGVTWCHDGYLEGGDFIVSWCVVHLLAMAEPGEYNDRYGKATWAMSTYTSNVSLIEHTFLPLSAL